jgi:phenylacetate-coenzyme A ligase PaaK-like adenylate-forming protein
MNALKGYEKFLLSSLDQLLEGNDGSVKPDNVQSKLNELDKIAKSMELYKSGNEFLLKDHLLKFNLARRSRNGEIQALEMIHCSSGSSSKSGPTYWGRDTCEELAVAVRFEQIFRDHFMAHEKSTLAVNCFPMGSWVGGIFNM